MIQDALYSVTHGQDLSFDLAKDTMDKIMSGQVDQIPMAGFLCALAAKGPTVEEITAFAQVMRDKAGSVPHEGTVVEIVGTVGMKLIPLIFRLLLDLLFLRRAFLWLSMVTVASLPSVGRLTSWRP